jgi:hypothetical protein
MSLFLTKTSPPVASSAVLSFASSGEVGRLQNIKTDRIDPKIDPTGAFIASPSMV